MEVVTAAAEAILPDQNRSKNWPLFVLALEILFISFSFDGHKLGKNGSPQRQSVPPPPAKGKNYV